MLSLSTPGLPWCLSIQGSVQDLTAKVYEWSRAGLTVRLLRGRKMYTYQALFDECAAALQFPWYFGENGHAFDECMADLSWLPPNRGYVFAVSDAVDVLKDTDNDGLSWLIDSLGRAAQVWSEPCEEGQPWDRPATPFHIVLQDSFPAQESAMSRWRERGAEITLLEEDEGRAL